VRADQVDLIRRLTVGLRGILLRTRISVVIAIVIAMGLLAVISRIAAARNSATELLTVLRQTWILVLGLTLPYLAARALVWQELLQEVGIKVPVRQMAMSFAGGEITKMLPAGAYVQNYLLARLVHFGRYSVIRSSMATTAMLGLETMIAVPVALVVGVPGQPWIFWTIIGILAVWIVVLALAWLTVHAWVPHVDDSLPPFIRRVREAIEEFLEAGRDLIKPRTARTLLPTCLYMLFYVISLYAIILALGIHNITFVDTAGIYALIVLAVILVPIPTEIGITEAAGFGALLAYGVPHSTAAIVMLSLRILATGSTILVATIVMILMRAELGSEVEQPVPVQKPRTSE